jgi:hypothetical protein
MCSLSRNALIFTAMLTVSLCSCGADPPGAVGFAISLSESGELILADEHIATYVWDEHRIVLTQGGLERWESFVEFDTSQDPPIRKLGRLTTKEFVVTLNGVEMYRGHFWSMASSLMKSGVLLYDTLGAPRGEVWMSFARSNGTPAEDPRAQPEVEAYFRKQGKLKEGRWGFSAVWADEAGAPRRPGPQGLFGSEEAARPAGVTRRAGHAARHRLAQLIRIPLGLTNKREEINASRIRSSSNLGAVHRGTNLGIRAAQRLVSGWE